MPHENWPLGPETELIPAKRDRDRERETGREKSGITMGYYGSKARVINRNTIQSMLHENCPLMLLPNSFHRTDRQIETRRNRQILSTDDHGYVQSYIS